MQLTDTNEVSSAVPAAEAPPLVSSLRPPHWTRRRARRITSSGMASMTENLTPKERECLYWAGRRLSDAEIALRLQLSTRTVGNHLARSYAKLGVHDRIRAAAMLSKLYPEYPLPIGFEEESAPTSSVSVQQTDAEGAGIAKVFAELPRPPSRMMRLVLILAVAASVAFVFAGVTVIMSVSADRVDMFAPENAR